VGSTSLIYTLRRDRYERFILAEPNPVP
jgi:hypothetical protein